MRKYGIMGVRPRACRARAMERRFKMDQKSIKNRPKSSIQNTPADAQPRIYKILLPTPSQAPLPTPSQGYTKSSCRRPERETMGKYGIMGALGPLCTSLAGRRQEDFRSKIVQNRAYKIFL